MATIKIPPVLRPSVGGEKEVQAAGDDVGAVLTPARRAAPRHPVAALRRRRAAEPLRQRVPQRRGRARPRRARHRGQGRRHARHPAGHGRRRAEPARRRRRPPVSWPPWPRCRACGRSASGRSSTSGSSSACATGGCWSCASSWLVLPAPDPLACSSCCRSRPERWTRRRDQRDRPGGGDALRSPRGRQRAAARASSTCSPRRPASRRSPTPTSAPTRPPAARCASGCGALLGASCSGSRSLAGIDRVAVGSPGASSPALWLVVAWSLSVAGAAVRAHRRRSRRCGARSGSCTGAAGRSCSCVLVIFLAA